MVLPTQSYQGDTVVIAAADLTMDLSTMMQGYAGPTLLHRLEFVANVVPELRFDALCMALRYLKESTIDTAKYLAICDVLERQFQKEVAAVGAGLIDREWASKTSAKADIEQKELEVAAREASLAQKEAVIATTNLAEFYIARGMLKNAVSEYASLEKHVSTQQLGPYAIQMIKILLLNKQYGRVIDRALKVVTRAKDSKEAMCIAGVGRAVAEIKFTQYGASVDHLMETPFDASEKLGHMVRFQDVAVFGTLCALATYDRPQIKNLMENANFKRFLEYEPKCQSMLSHYVKAQYKECFGILDERKADFLLDIYLHRHVDQLYKKIYDRSIVLYLQPYSVVSMQTMAASLGFDMKTLQEKLVALVRSNAIDCLINTHDMILTRKACDDRSKTFTEVLDQAASFETKVKGTILHVNFQKCNVMTMTDAAKSKAYQKDEGNHDQDMME